MRVVENTAERLVLRGKPGGALWMGFATLLGLVFMGVTAWFGWVTFHEIGGYLQLIPMGIGFLMGFGFFCLGAVTLLVGRMSLTLDRVTGEGVYEVVSPIIEAGKPCRFRLEHVNSVTVEASTEARHRTEGQGGFDAQVCRARLRINKPRRAIELDETQNGQEPRVERVAQSVAEWLDLEVTRTS